jgi:hypothetical protein
VVHLVLHMFLALLWSVVHFWNNELKLKQGPLSLVSRTEEQLEEKSSGSSLEIREYSLGIHHTDHVAASVRESWH